MKKLTDCPFHENVEKALNLTRKEMEDDSGDAWPRLLVFSTGKKISYFSIDPRFMDDWHKKNLIGALIIKQCFIPDTQCCVFLSDSYCVKQSKDESRDDLPRDFSKLPKSMRGEAILTTVNAKGTAGFVLMHHYNRASNDKRIFEPEPEIQVVAEGRFVFDLTSAITEEGAVLDAMFRNRNGVVEKQ